LSTAYRTSVLLALVVVLLFCSVGSVQAIGLVTVPTTHQQATLNVVNNRPNLTALVLGVWPDFFVRGGYGGMAFPGYIDVNTHLWGIAYTDLVAHEWGHEVQRAADASGRGLTQAWRALMLGKGWDVSAVALNHAFTENLCGAYWYPYYANAPDTPYLVSKAEMTAFLQSIGVTP
jgi:hypothetical protein